MEQPKTGAMPPGKRKAISPLEIPSTVQPRLESGFGTQKLTIVPFAYFATQMPARKLAKDYNWQALYFDQGVVIPLPPLDEALNIWQIPEGLPRNAFFALRIHLVERRTFDIGEAFAVLRKDKRPAHLGYPSVRAQYKPFLHGELFVAQSLWQYRVETADFIDEVNLYHVRPQWSWKNGQVNLLWRLIWTGGDCQFPAWLGTELMEAAQCAVQKSQQRRRYGRLRRSYL